MPVSIINSFNWSKWSRTNAIEFRKKDYYVKKNLKYCFWNSFDLIHIFHNNKINNNLQTKKIHQNSYSPWRMHLIQFRNYWEFEFFNSSSGNRNRSTDFIGWDLPPFSGAQRQNGRKTDWIFMKLCWINSIQTHGLEGREREKKYSQKKRELYNTLEK